MENNMENNEICIQINCKFSFDNKPQRYGYTDLINEDSKIENFNNQFIHTYSENEEIEKIFRQTFEEQNLPRLFIQGYDITVVKYGKRNVFYEDQSDGSKGNQLSSSSSTSTSSAEENEDDSSSEREDEETGIVQSFIRSIFEELVSLKDTQSIFSVGWTEINDQNQLLDLLNGTGLIQCNSVSQLFDAISLGLKNKNNTNNHNILSIVLEQQQLISNVTGQIMHKLSTVNFCDLNYGTEKAFTNQFISEPPRDLPMNFYSQPMLSALPPYPYFTPQNNNLNFINGNNILSPPPANFDTFFNTNFPRHPTFDMNPNNLVNQQNQRLLRNAELLFSKLNLNDVEEEQRKEIQEWIYMKTECDNYSVSPSMELPQPPPPPPSYFCNNLNNAAGNFFINHNPAPMTFTQQQQQTSLLPIIEMDETNDERDNNDDNDEQEEEVEVYEEEEGEETNDNYSESGSYIDINDQSNNLFGKISDKVSKFQEKSDDLVIKKCEEYFDNNPKVILSSGQSDSCIKPMPEQLHDEAVGGDATLGSADFLQLSTNTSTSEQYLAKTGRRRSIRDNTILNSDELNLIKKAAAATSLEGESINENAESEQQLSKLDELRKSLKKSMA